jgi:RNA-binding protein
MSEPITSNTRKTLRGRAQNLEPTVFYGKQGLSEPFLAELNAALDQRQLVKIRLTTAKDRRKQIAGELAESTRAELIDLVGHVVVLYRPKSPETPPETN